MLTRARATAMTADHAAPTANKNRSNQRTTPTPRARTRTAEPTDERAAAAASVSKPRAAMHTGTSTATPKKNATRARRDLAPSDARIVESCRYNLRRRAHATLAPTNPPSLQKSDSAISVNEPGAFSAADDVIPSRGTGVPRDHDVHLGPVSVASGRSFLHVRKPSTDDEADSGRVGSTSSTESESEWDNDFETGAKSARGNSSVVPARRVDGRKRVQFLVNGEVKTAGDVSSRDRYAGGKTAPRTAHAPSVPRNHEVKAAVPFSTGKPWAARKAPMGIVKQDPVPTCSGPLGMVVTGPIKTTVPVFFAAGESSPVNAMWQRLPADRALPTSRLSSTYKPPRGGLGFDLGQFDGLSLEGADDVTT
ncbi:hypothetical protein GGF32_004891 [Allomyces javanicus]|nr:hypothetical protein GGF32_004891 [Allomyces javanicus]